MARIAVIVEGHGEVQAVPVLLRRIGAEVAPNSILSVPRPIRVSRHRIVQEGRLERYLNIAVAHGGPEARVLILLDANGDCPAKLGPTLLKRARAARSDKRIQLVLAKQEYESWFIAASESVVSGSPVSPPDPESIRGAKEWIRRSQQYRPTVDQAPMTAEFDMEQARRRAPSFDKMWRGVRLSSTPDGKRPREAITDDRSRLSDTDAPGPPGDGRRLRTPLATIRDRVAALPPRFPSPGERGHGRGAQDGVPATRHHAREPAKASIRRSASLISSSDCNIETRA